MYQFVPRLQYHFACKVFVAILAVNIINQIIPNVQ